jgi:6-phosphogluconate dehydrogenase (decarboxylating)
VDVGTSDGVWGLERGYCMMIGGESVPVLTTALYERFASRGEADYQDKLLSAMRFGFGGQRE